MERHVKNYLQAFGYDESDTILCESCGNKAVDIHHVESRSSFGSKRKKEQDEVSNLIALCRPCHDEAHGYQSRIVKEALKEIVRRRST
jgi:5-methylcytosine-specific restriction endonuclease McrA